MMNSPAYDIANLLEASPIGIGVVGTDIFISSEPTIPDTCITLFDTGGFESDSRHGYERPTVQITIRHLSYTGGYDLAKSIKDALHGQYELTEGGSRYIMILAMSDVNFIGCDDNNRSKFTINLLIHRTATS